VSLIEIEVFEEHCSAADKTILRLLRLILQNQETEMTTQEQFDAALTALIAAEAARDAAVTAALTDLIAKVAAGNTTNLDAELAQVLTLQTNAASITATATADDPGPTTVPTTPPADGSTPA
jgi:hypothetical protein